MARISMWSGQSTIQPRRLSVAKSGLVVVITVTCIVPLLFVEPDAAPWYINAYKYLAKTGAFVGSMLLIWQFLLGFRGLVASVLPDLPWVVGLHKNLGMYGVPIIVLHPIFIGVYYWQTRDRNIYALDLGTQFSQLVLLGMIALTVIVFVVVTSIAFRKRMGFYTWLYTHLSSYLIPPLMFVHGFLLGPTVQNTVLLYYWWFFTVVVLLLFVYRVAHRLGAAARRYGVTGIRQTATETTEILMAPRGRALTTAPGQFVYLRRSLRDNSHPYSISAQQDDGVLGVTVQQQGPQTTALQQIQRGEEIILDGAFGVFTRVSAAVDRPLVMIAGGIGITPFRVLWQRLERDRDRGAHLFYANETYRDISYRDELDRLTHVRVTHVLNDEPDHDGETGLVNVDLLRRTLDGELDDYQFLLCGPPPMILSIEEELSDAGVPAEQVDHELFDS